MRIISPFHDYYDVVQAQGQDQSLLYLRQPREVELEGSPFSFTKLLQRCGGDLIGDCYIVGFCGKIHPILYLQNIWAVGVKPAACFCLEEADNYVWKHFKKNELDSYYFGSRRKAKRSIVEVFFRECLEQQRCYEQLFLDNRCPVFIYRENRHHTITFNGCLRSVEFYRKVDPYTAFQEIQMFLGGLAFPCRPIPAISDKTMAEIKGFDKWSFRKEPTRSK